MERGNDTASALFQSLVKDPPPPSKAIFSQGWPEYFFAGGIFFEFLNGDPYFAQESPRNNRKAHSRYILLSLAPKAPKTFYESKPGFSKGHRFFFGRG